VSTLEVSPRAQELLDAGQCDAAARIIVADELRDFARQIRTAAAHYIDQDARLLVFLEGGLHIASDLENRADELDHPVPAAAR
jgi:hypothetical protein